MIDKILNPAVLPLMYHCIEVEQFDYIDGINQLAPLLIEESYFILYPLHH